MDRFITVHDWAWDKARDAFERSLQLNPGYASAYHWYGVDHLAMLGRFPEAYAKQEMAVKLDPLSPLIADGLGYLQLLMRDYDRAIEIYSGIMAADPSFYRSYTSMGRAYLHKGMYARAIEFLEKGMTMAREKPLVF